MYFLRDVEQKSCDGAKCHRAKCPRAEPDEMIYNPVHRRGCLARSPRYRGTWWATRPCSTPTSSVITYRYQPTAECGHYSTVLNKWRFSCDSQNLFFSCAAIISGIISTMSKLYENKILRKYIFLLFPTFTQKYSLWIKYVVYEILHRYPNFTCP